nr:hypothetical protein I308_01998 [Cryptococcus tetragattii IND107]
MMRMTIGGTKQSVQDRIASDLFPSASSGKQIALNVVTS